MMSDMIDYTTELLRVISVWLGSEPIIYLFGVVVGCFVIKMLFSLMAWR